MSDPIALTEAERERAAAYVGHCSERDPGKSLRPYKKSMASHPSVPQAGYSLNTVPIDILRPCDEVDRRRRTTGEGGETED